MPMSYDLSRDDCSRLLKAGVAGRVALGTPDGPHIIPVNYAVDSYDGQESVLVRTTAYSLLGTYGRDAQVCFEVDQFDHEQKRGWSVVVRGRASFVQDHEELDRMARSWQPRPWAEGQRHLVVRIPWTEVTGRQLGGGWDPWEHLPVRRLA
ncbi:pyridoxamine 5'-phosphate oxidase family protein [Nocardioides glacieisoli]|uniref:Pyridoxamine 5'-phosphate oxidase family protein n=1 Tax=Nocardioides glacieisoli TaxID=1168730 RepID=A0A4Q2RUT7_9ACTN|nr:pyridoxamine 5'-phosphate oxidase family protein [Nocardioides glacieisoli]RYB92618.1 pyridoxamine 5'-phosphate oxidase family protein [Nocardioides glacieisoli]